MQSASFVRQVCVVYRHWRSWKKQANVRMNCVMENIVDDVNADDNMYLMT